jgi:hypothetical protein
MLKQVVYVIRTVRYWFIQAAITVFYVTVNRFFFVPYKGHFLITSEPINFERIVVMHAVDNTCFYVHI